LNAEHYFDRFIKQKYREKLVQIFTFLHSNFLLAWLGPTKEHTSAPVAASKKVEKLHKVSHQEDAVQV
jgi:hypothetical protein